jgi:hypothetical protein
MTIQMDNGQWAMDSVDAIIVILLTILSKIILLSLTR